MSEENHFQKIASELKLKVWQVHKTVELLDSENTVPFIARYRKEATGNLDEEQIRDIEERIRSLRVLDARKETVLNSIEKQGKLTPELKEKILAAEKLQEVEDLYLPYKPKRRTRATIAKEKGLEPLADKMLALATDLDDFDEFVSSFIDEEKGVNSAEDALAGARDICAEAISDNADVRKVIREIYQKSGALHSEAKVLEEYGNYEVYADFSHSLKTIQPHQVLAINRGEREGFLKVEVEVPESDCISEIERMYLTDENSPFYEHLKMAIADSYNRLISPSIEREMRSGLTEIADEHAIEIFAKNLRNLLMQPPIRGVTIIGIDPGFRTGCKAAVIDATGKFLEGATIYPHPPQNHWQEAKETLLQLAKKYNAQVLSIGNGTASRETETLAIEVIENFEGDLSYIIVNEAGASVYSASKLAREEFPDLDVSMRGAISIARRLLDPLSELVKIDPKSIGVGLYQHDVNQARLSQALDQVVESAVNFVGVNLNTASKALLQYVAGINSRIAENIVKMRDEQGKFESREQLKDVKGMGENSFTQCAGFLRIPDAENFFDMTAVHPESYEAAQKLLEELELDSTTVRGNGELIEKRIREKKLSVQQLAEVCGTGVPTMDDIIDSLAKPNRDPRDELPKPIFRRDVLKIEDLKEGMILVGTVRNVVDFGAFVDIGVKNDGLVHKSKLAKKYVKNPIDVVSVGQNVKVKVISVDPERGRISLSMVIDE
ncbi:RNA-binding transcriptional accessory protein [candidate division KSB1 bacterium 4484_87]|nr:MAG: RNA-binding transcriptional accessory protein [candidate division KSB1 bacterium 4484_87]